MTEFTVIIPARYGSTRFPGKPLAIIHGKPMIQHVYEKAQACGAKRVIIATDDSRIADVAATFDAQVCMTSDQHISGTTRIAEVIDTLGIEDDEIIVNVQGDEPFIPEVTISQVANNLANASNFDMATLAYPISDSRDLFNPNVVKAVVGEQGRAMYFSRSPVPFYRDGMPAEDAGSLESHPQQFLRHIGLYAYRAGFIRTYMTLSETEIESIESLEQLRVLAHGHSIHIDISAAAPPHGVDTPEDIKRFEQD